MTKLLVKWFIKDAENVQNRQVRTQYGILASIVGIISNILLFAVKAIIGLTIGSISVTADAFNNLSDAASSIISFVGVKIANRPPDREHPFGHGRYEYIAALIVAFLVFEVGVTCLKSSLDKVFHPQAVEFKLILVVILCLSIFVKVWLGFFNRKLGRIINSSVMKATSADAFGDVLITSATVISIIVGHITNLKIDGYMGVLVSLIVLYAGFGIAKDTLEPLIGEAVSPETYDLITKKVESYEGIIGSHDLIVHNYGPSNTMATIHAEVPSDMNIEEAHDLIDGIERDVLRELDIFLVIHMDPLEVNNQVVMDLKRKVKGIIKELDSNASLHDFRMVSGEHYINIIFDLVVPHDYTDDQENELLLHINGKVSALDNRYQCSITPEHSFIAMEDKK